MMGATRVPFACGVVLTVLAGGVGRASPAHAADPVIEPRVQGASEAAAAPVEKTRATPTFAGDAHVYPALEPPSLSHERQFGIGVFIGSGFRVLFPYQEQVYCGQIGKRACSGRQPAFLDLQAAYGATAHWEVVAELRLGLEDDFAGTRAVALAPGVRYWADPPEALKFFTTLQLAIDFSEQHNRRLTGYDLAFHNANGLMFEIMRDLGFYAQIGETVGFIRWLRFEIDIGAGVQARFP